MRTLSAHTQNVCNLVTCGRSKRELNQSMVLSYPYRGDAFVQSDTLLYECSSNLLCRLATLGAFCNLFACFGLLELLRATSTLRQRLDTLSVWILLLC